MSTIKYHFWTLLCIVLLSSCKNQNTVSVSSKNFEDVVAQQQNLIFTFDKDLVDDSLIDRWDSTQFVTITPAVRGLFKWNTKRELMFSPETSFGPATFYKAVVTDRILYGNRLLSFDAPAAFEFHTPLTQLENLHAHWALSTQQNSIVLLTKLDFNYPVPSAQMKDLAQIKINDKIYPFTVVTNTASTEVVLEINNIQPSDYKKVNVSVAINKGLMCNGSNYKTENILVEDTDVPLPDRLTIMNASGEYDNTQPVIHVFTNQAVNLNQIAAYVTVQPRVDFTTEAANDGFLIKGAFDPGQSYQLTVKKELNGLIGGMLDQDFIATIPFGEMQPSISFTNASGMYLSSKGNRNVGIQIVNVPKVRVSVYKVYENNILNFLRQNSYSDYYEGSEDGYTSRSQYSIYGIENYGDLVMQRNYGAKSLPRGNGNNLLNLSLDEINAYKGIYVVDVASTDDYWLHDTKVIALSDIGMIAKYSENELTVFTNFIKTALPAEGVNVSCISTNNQVLFNGTTDHDGRVTFSDIGSKAKNFRVGMISARQGKDFNMILLSETKVSTSRYDVGGYKDNPAGVMAYIYGDRDMYRPGETVYLNTIVRNDKWMPVANVPVKLKMTMPNGHEFKTLRKSLNSQGAVAADFLLPQVAVTGNYNIDIFSANDVLIGSRTIQVEEFIPDRIDVKVKVNKSDFHPADTIVAAIAATNFFGPPAAMRKFEAEFNLIRKSFSSKDFSGYNFTVKTLNELPLDKKIEQGQTNEKGEATAKFLIPDSCKNSGLLQGRIYTTVFDETGRPVNRLNTFDVNTQQNYFGIKLNDYYANIGTNTLIGLAACNSNGKGATATAYVEIINYDWYNVVEKSDNGQYRYVSQKREVTMLSREVHIAAGGSSLNFIPANSGEYEVRISAVKGGNYVASNFWAYGFGYTSNTSFNINTEGQVTIQADKDTFAPGEKANLLFKTPFAGKLLVTIESNKILKHYYINTDKRSAMLSVPVSESYLPNVYVSATLFKPLDDGAMPLTVAHGFMPLIVSKPELKLPVAITCAAKSKSKKKQTIKVRSVPNAELTVAVVDEGILALKNQKSPDPFGYFYQKKALQTTTYDVYAQLLPDLKMRSSTTGGDGFDLARRVNPLSNKRVQLVALWSGILKTNAAGDASFNIEIPQFSGKLRVMACSWKDNRFGSSEQFITVADPVVISPSVPRFLSPGDSLEMPVTFTNTTAMPLTLGVSCTVTGNLKLSNNASSQLTIAPSAEARFVWNMVASSAIGQGSIEVKVNTGSESFSDKTSITIRPPSSLVKETSNGVAKGNTTMQVASDFVSGSTKVYFTLSASPLVQFTDQLIYLLDYPHGCLEQTVSIAFPQLYYGNLAKNITNKSGVAYNPQFNVQEAIRKIEGMQIYNGSMTYWPGSVIENWWATAYALHFLTEARKAGYEVNESTINRTFEYLKSKVKTKETEKVYFANASNVIEKQVKVKREIIYSLYLLAINDRRDLTMMNYYKANHQQLTIDSKYMLALSYLAIGDTKSYLALLPDNFAGEKSERSLAGNFSSYVRDQALTLNCLLETDPDNAQIPNMARTLSQLIKGEKWLSTQERAFAFLALGKFAKRSTSTNVRATVFADGKELGVFSGADLVLNSNQLAGKKIEIRTEDKGQLYYFLELSGIKTGLRVKEEDSKLSVRRSYFNRFGQQMSNNFKQGDLIVVQLALNSPTGIDVANVVLTDLIPSGFEIENPRIVDDREMTWIKSKSQPDYFDIRDDRINLYTQAGKTTKYFYYTVRAVNTGSFVVGPVSADAMYDGEFHSYSGSGRVKVVK